MRSFGFEMIIYLPNLEAYRLYRGWNYTQIFRTGLSNWTIYDDPSCV